MVYGHFGIGIVLFVFFLVIDVILYAFNAAIRMVGVNDISESREGKAKYREMLLKILESPSQFNDTVNIIVYITNIIAGSYILGSFARRIITAVKNLNDHIFAVLVIKILFGQTSGTIAAAALTIHGENRHMGAALFPLFLQKM